MLARGLATAYRNLRPSAPLPRLETVAAEAFYGPGYDDSEVRIPSVTKAARRLGWRPRRSLREMLPAIVADYLARYEDELTRPQLSARAAGSRGGR